jgi:hypothetical protein
VANGMASRFENGRATTLVELAINAVALAGGQAAMWLSRISALQPSQMAGQPARRQANGPEVGFHMRLLVRLEGRLQSDPFARSEWATVGE